MMHKNFVASLIVQFVPDTGCGPNLLYKRMKLCEKQI